MSINALIQDKKMQMKAALHHFNIYWVLVYLAVILLVLFTALPLIYVACTAFKPMEELFVFPPRFFVKNPTTINFSDLLMTLGGSTVPFLRYAFNSVVITFFTVGLTVILCSMGAYGLVKYRLPGGGFMFSIIVAALMFSPHVTQISRYMVVNGLGLTNSFLGVIIINVAVAFNFFLMKQFVEQYPNELIEAARIDGAGELKIFYGIVMPSLKPAWTTLIVFSFTSTWNDYFTPLVYLSKQSLKTLPLALQSIAGGPAAAAIGTAGRVSAATFLMIIPVVIVFLIMQRSVMETLTYSGIKG